MIDASSWTGSSDVGVDGAAGGYTGVLWADTTNGSADDGLTVTPNGGDTGKTLFFPNAGWRQSGIAGYYGSRGFYLSADQHTTSTTNAWDLTFASTLTSGRMNYNSKLYAYSIRCVRS